MEHEALIASKHEVRPMQALDDSVDLTPTEILSLRAIGMGNGFHKTADLMDISEQEVRVHLASARKKLHARNTLHALSKATRMGFIAPQ